MKASDVVLSVPAGQSFVLVYKYGVHAYPASYSYVRPYDFLAVREPGGIMRALFRVTDTFVLSAPYTVPSEGLSADKRERLAAYRRGREITMGFGDDAVPFAFLLLEEVAKLAHAPRTASATRAHTYFAVGELTSGEPTVRPLVIRA